VTASAAIKKPAHDDAPKGDHRARFEDEAIPYMKQMFPAALRLTRDRCDAEDLIQETFARAYLKFHQFTPDTNLRAWLHRIMFRTFYTACRKRRCRPAETLSGDLYDGVDTRAGHVVPTRSAEAEALDNLGGSPVMRALRELPEVFKTVLYLADVEGYRYAEIAEIMGTPIGTVMSRIHRGRQMLRVRLTGAAEVAGPGRVRGPVPAARASAARANGARANVARANAGRADAARPDAARVAVAALAA
jgi:RNA polymerase sigma-70 factor, ECF subfamily